MGILAVMTMHSRTKRELKSIELKFRMQVCYVDNKVKSASHRQFWEKEKTH